MQMAEVLRTLLMYFVLPLWLAAGFADYLCHRAAHIERTSGWKESLLHLLQFGEMALPILAALFLEINAGVILLMIVCLILHEATAYWDRRQLNPALACALKQWFKPQGNRHRHETRPDPASNARQPRTQI
jgi:hypothetical protein